MPFGRRGWNPDARPPPAPRARMPVTATERLLARLARSTFLSLWSYPNVFKDTGHAAKGGHGQELCDLLALLGDDVLVFSDKECAYPTATDPAVAWGRWYRGAIEHSAKQLIGAARWLREHPSRVFADPACKVPLAWHVPAPSRARVHRIAIANGASNAARGALGGQGTLLHAPAPAEPERPFVVPQREPFVHVFDEVSFPLVLEELDTMGDLVAYLRARERFLRSGRATEPVCEEDLLGTYLAHVDDRDLHEFPSGARQVRGAWDRFVSSPERVARIDADEVSYVWDRLIEHAASTATRFTAPGVLGGAIGPAQLERGLRWMASESRLARRGLAAAWVAFVRSGATGFRSVLPPDGTGRAYVFLVHRRDRSVPYREDREYRTASLYFHAVRLAVEYPLLTEIAGIACDESVPGAGGSEDFLFFEPVHPLDPTTVAQAREYCDDLGLFQSPTKTPVSFMEYPTGTTAHTGGVRRATTRIGRNDPCPCGSGSKYKRCHGRSA